MKKTGLVNRMISMALLLAMVLTLLPSSALAAEGDKQYGYLVIRNDSKNRVVNFRRNPNTNDNGNFPIARLPEGWVIEVLGSQTEGKTVWYRVSADTNLTGVGSANYQTGYIMADFVQLFTEEQQAAWLLNPVKNYTASGASVTPSPTPTATATNTAAPGAVLGYVRTVVDKVNMRQEPSGTVINEKNQIPVGTVMAYYAMVNDKGYNWAQVRYDGMSGYVRSDCYAACDALGNLLSDITPTPVPGQTTVPPASATGYIRITVDKVAMRETPGGKVINDNKRLAAGRVLAYTAGPVSYGGYDWVQVTDSVSGLTGYVRSDCYAFTDSTGTLPTATPKPGQTIPVGSRFVRVKANKEILALRAQPSTASEILNGGKALPNGTVFVLEEELLDTNSYDWARITYNGQTGYVPSTDYFECDAKGAPLESAGINGFVQVTASDLKLCFYPGQAEATAPVVPVGSILTWISGYSATRNGQNWIYVSGEQGEGYICETDFAVADAFVTHSFRTVSGSSATAAPSFTVAPATILGYIRISASNVAMRETPGGTVLNDTKRLAAGRVLPYTEGPVSYGGYSWVKAVDSANNSLSGYVRSDCYQFCNADGTVIATATPTPTPSLVPSVTATPVPGIIAPGTYGRVTADNVFFRKTMSINGDFWARLPLNWPVMVLGSEYSGGILWYKVQGGTPTNPDRTYTGFIHGSFLTIISTVTASPTPVPGTTPAPAAEYAVVTLGGINMRQAPGGAAQAVLLADTVVQVISKPENSTAYDWYYVYYNNTYGYLPASALRVLTPAELPNYNLPTVAPATPTATPVPAITGTGYVRLKLDKVNIRKTPGGTVLTPTEGSKLKVGLVLPYTEGPVAYGGYDWVKIAYADKVGYIRSDCYVYTDASGNAATPTPSVTTTPDSTAGQNYIRLTMGGVNLRRAPWGETVAQLNKGVILPCFGTITQGTDTWYDVYYAEKSTYGYILSTMATLCDVNGNTIVPTVAPSSTPATLGYVATSVSSVWLRANPEVNAATAGKVGAKGTVLPMTGAPVVNGAYTWYPVVLPNGSRGYLRGDCAYQLADWQLDYYKQHGVVPTPTPGPATPPPGNSDYIITTADKLWVRETPSTKAGTLGQLGIGTVTKFYQKQAVGNVMWYQIMVGSQFGWVHGDFARVLTNAEYYQWKGTEAPTATPTAMPDPSTLSDMAMTTIERVKLRASGSMSGRELTMIEVMGTTGTYLGKYNTPTATNPYYWFNVKFGNFTGWMRGDCVRILTKTEKEAYNQSGSIDAPKEASYRTLSKNDTGDDVRRLQQALVSKGYLAADQVSGVYLTSTEKAVIAFQQANKLVVDGIAGENTQHALFNTVPVGTYSNGSSTTVTLYPVEKIDWYTGGIQSIFKVGTVAVVTDVYTGISFRAQRLYGDNHADCEPLTTADTAAICRIFGVTNAQEISDRESQLESWRRRPLWVTIGGRTFAASMYGIPHNYSGDRIPDNNYNGQFCIHFVNSKTHSTDRVDTDASYNGYFGHQSAINYAYSHSISGTK